jgi:hypothetical protein
MYAVYRGGAAPQVLSALSLPPSLPHAQVTLAARVGASLYTLPGWCTLYTKEGRALLPALDSAGKGS